MDFNITFLNLGGLVLETVEVGDEVTGVQSLDIKRKERVKAFIY